MPTTRHVLETTIALERQSMALYARFAKSFAHASRLHDFWFGMARDEARHVGALDLVLSVLGLEGVLDGESPIAFDESAVARLRQLLERSAREASGGGDFAPERALEIAVEVEETELEDMVGDLLRALQEPDEYQRCMRLLVHDLGELSYMIERYCHDSGLLARCDALVNRHAEALRLFAAR